MTIKRLHKSNNTKKNLLKMASYILVAAFAIFLIAQIINIHSQMEQITSENQALTDEIKQIQQNNEELQYGIDHSNDPDTVEDIARKKLDLVKQGEIIFYDSSN